MAVPLLDLKAQYEGIREEVGQAIDRVLESQRFILGPEVEGLEREIAEYCGCEHAVGVSSGTDALLISLMAIGIQAGDEVITAPFSFFATASSIVRLGARPVFVDIDPVSFNIDATKVEAALTQRTKAIIPVHLFGQMADLDPILSIAKRRKLYVIEDAAQAIGAEYKGRRAGSIGHFGCFSFFPSKNLGGLGDGGMVTCRSPEMADRLKLLRNHGEQPQYFHKAVGGNFRLDALQAAVLRVKLKHLEGWTRMRRRNANRYRRHFSESCLGSFPENLHCLNNRACRIQDGDCQLQRAQRPQAILPAEKPDCRHIYNQFVVRVPGRDALMPWLRSRGIGCQAYYPLSLHQQECFAFLGYRQNDFPASRCAAQQALALPVYAELSSEQQAEVVRAVASFFKDGAGTVGERKCQGG